jgi:hypothetical protein
MSYTTTDMKRVNDQLHANNHAPANTMDAVSHPQKHVQHANALCLTVSHDVDSHQGHLKTTRARDCLTKMEIDHNHVEVHLFQPLLGFDAYL